MTGKTKIVGMIALAVALAAGAGVVAYLELTAPAHKVRELMESLHGSNSRQAEEVRKELDALGSPAVPAICDWLSEPVAAQALGDIGDKRAVDSLIWAIWNSQSGAVVCAAIEALGKIGDPRALDDLTRVLQDPNPGVRKEARVDAAGSMGKLGDRKAVWPLVRALEDGDFRLRLAAIQSLGELGDARALSALTVMAERGDYAERPAAVKAIARITAANPTTTSAATSATMPATVPGPTSATGHD
jgi:HEAT repeat protein